MSRTYRNPFKDARPYMGAEEGRPKWLPDDDPPEPEPEVPVPAHSVESWEALRDVIPAAHEVIAILGLHHLPAVREIAAEAGEAIERVASQATSKSKRCSRPASRWDFTQCVKAFRTLAALATATNEEHMGHLPGYELLASVRPKLVAQLQACEPSFGAYGKEMKRLKAMERLGRK